MHRFIVIFMFSIMFSVQSFGHAGCCHEGVSFLGTVRHVAELYLHAHELFDSYQKGELLYLLSDWFHVVELVGHAGNLFHYVRGVKDGKLIFALTAYNLYGFYAQLRAGTKNLKRDNYIEKLTGGFGTGDGLLHLYDVFMVPWSWWTTPLTAN